MNIDKIYFLTLRCNIDRVNNVKCQIDFLRTHNITNYEIFYNYRWPKSITSLLNFNCKNSSSICSCTTGHYAIMQDAILNNYSNIIICEDDIQLNENFIKLIKNEIDYPDDYDCIRLFSTIDNNQILKDADKEYYNKYFFKIINNDLRYWTTALYMCKNTFIKAYFEYYDNVMTHADYIWNDKKYVSKFNIYYTNNNFCKNLWYSGITAGKKNLV